MTHDRLMTAFPDSEIVTASPEGIPDAITDAAARRVLTEVGVPIEGIVSCIYFQEIDEKFETMEALREPSKVPKEVTGHFIIAISDYYSMCFDGSTGECRFVSGRDNSVSLAASGVDLFLEAMCKLNVELDAFVSGENGNDPEQVEDRLIAELRAADPVAVTDSEEAWRTLIQRCFGEVTR